MALNRREFFKTTALGTTGLALTPSFNQLLAAPADGVASTPHRFVFVRKVEWQSDQSIWAAFVFCGGTQEAQREGGL
jgi:hypothetical protein